MNIKTAPFQTLKKLTPEEIQALAAKYHLTPTDADRLLLNLKNEALMAKGGLERTPVSDAFSKTADGNLTPEQADRLFEKIRFRKLMEKGGVSMTPETLAEYNKRVWLEPGKVTDGSNLESMFRVGTPYKSE